jgi:hypothetical protein
MMPHIGRICIGGGPRTGKTRLAAECEARGMTVHHTDALIGSHEWSEASAEVARWLDEPGPFVVEGVAIARALRKWLAAHPEGRPCEVLYWARRPWVEQTPGQAIMAKGCEKVFAEIRPELERRGVRIVEVP